MQGKGSWIAPRKSRFSLLQTLECVERQLIVLVYDRRHLLRLWQRNEALAWPTPPALEERFKLLFKKVPVERQRFPLEPEIRSISRGRGLEDKAKGT